jgi:ribonucleotide monophosphatase NagD (HAD superfamily)
MNQKPPKDVAGFIFDVDGCVARGTEAIPGVPATLAHLRARGIRCAFLTNDNTSTRSQVVAKLVAMGIPCTAEDVVTAAIVAAEVTRALHPVSAGVAGEPRSMTKRSPQGLWIAAQRPSRTTHCT